MGPPLQLTFVPIAGRLDHDLFISFFTDRGNHDQVFDFNGGPLAYKGHKGVDFEVQSLAHIDIGIPVFAAMAGTVTEATAEQFDRNTSAPPGGLANYVYLDHGNGVTTRYGHLAKHSLLVKAGQQVAAGQQLACAGSAGSSDGPHLHFEIRRDAQILESFAGKVNPDPLVRWMRQPLVKMEFMLSDAGLVAGTSPGMVLTRDFVMQRPAHINVFGPEAEQALLWVRLRNLKQGDRIGVEIHRPDGSVFDASTEEVKEDTRWDWRGWPCRLPAAEARAGAWTVAFQRNQGQVIAFPIHFGAYTKIAENPPLATPQIRLLPETPSPQTVVCCEVLSPTTQPGEGVIAYTYTWIVNGQMVRIVTSAAESDYLWAGAAGPGQIVTCEVTAKRGTDTAGPTKTQGGLP